MGIIETILKDKMTQGYLAAALWAETDNDGEPLDANYSVEDIDAETLEDFYADCLEFVTKVKDTLPDFYQSEFDDIPADSLGHDLWLTRNRHGAGFWDRGYPRPMADFMTLVAHRMGEYSLYEGEDGKIYGNG